MTRLSSSTLMLAALPLLAFGCSSVEKSGPKDSDCQEGKECSCDDGEGTGESICVDGVAECECGGSSDSDDDGTALPSKDAGTGTKDASTGTKDSGTGTKDSGTGTKDSGTGTGTKDASTGTKDAGGGDDEPAPSKDAGTTKDSGGSTPVDPPPATDGDAPVLPAIKGECPEFKSGTATIGGLAGISLQVGAKKEGTGSLIFYWHGTGSFAGESNIMMPAAMRNELLAQGGIIVSPQRSLGKGGDCSGTATFSKGDMEVADLIAACAVKNHGIDPRRIYTTGCSAGGLQAGCMATLRSSYIAAAVPNSGGIVFPQPIQDPKHIPALMTMHGGPQDMVIVSFSQTSATLDNQFSKAGGYVVNCNHGGGHCGAPTPVYQAGWQFMKDHPFGAKPYKGGALPSSYPASCKALTP